MATYKVLAQSAPSAASATTLYTAGNAVIVSTLNVSNTGGAADTIRIAVRPIQLLELHPLVRSEARQTSGRRYNRRYRISKCCFSI
jgi:hypothetical protein